MSDDTTEGWQERSKSLEWISTAPPKIYDPGPAVAQQQTVAPDSPPVVPPPPSTPGTT